MYFTQTCLMLLCILQKTIEYYKDTSNLTVNIKGVSEKGVFLITPARPILQNSTSEPRGMSGIFIIIFSFRGLLRILTFHGKHFWYRAKNTKLFKIKFPIFFNYSMCSTIQRDNLFTYFDFYCFSWRIIVY